MEEAYVLMAEELVFDRAGPDRPRQDWVLLGGSRGCRGWPT